MPIELTDEDRKEIDRLWIRPRHNDNSYDDIEIGYRAGLAVGLERAAKVCEDQVWDSDAGDAWHYAVERCVSAIRYLLK